VHAKLRLFERRGRSLREWRHHLAGLTGEAGYRAGAVTAGELGAAIADPSLSAEHRIAAVLALSATDPAEARRRARVGAAASVDPDLRAALDEAAEGEVDDARLDRLVAR
jgi:hypothetical protein